MKFILLFNKQKLLILLISICYNLHLNSQEALGIVPVDNSFNIESEYQKQLKSYPNIEVANVGDSAGMIIHRNLVYTQHGQRSLHADVIYLKTPSQRPLPVIIFIHGGGWRSGNKSMEHPLAFEMARRGYASVCVEYRLSIEAQYPAAVQDIIKAIKWVKYNPLELPFDTEMIILEGTSAGAQIASLIGSINGTKELFDTDIYPGYSSSVQAVINIDGVVAFIHPDSSEGVDKPGKPSAASLWFGTTISENSAPFLEASAINHVNQSSAPVLFVNSSIPRFSAGRDDMIKIMDNYGISSRVHQHQDSMHTFWLFHPWFYTTANWIDSFLREKILTNYNDCKKANK